MNTVEQISDSILTQMQTSLGADFKPLSYFFDVSQNNFVGNKKRFGVVPLSGSNNLTVTKSFTVDQNFQMILTDNYKNVGNSDSKQRDVLFFLYDKFDEIIATLYMSKLGIPNIVLFTGLQDFAEPEFLDEENLAVLKVNIIVKYRRSI